MSASIGKGIFFTAEGPCKVQPSAHWRIRPDRLVRRDGDLLRCCLQGVDPRGTGPCLKSAVFRRIVIRFYYREHPPRHFHAIYAEHEALIEIETGKIHKRFLPKKALELVNEWCVLILRNLKIRGKKQARTSAEPNRPTMIEAN
jgi:hypothetical protein